MPLESVARIDTRDRETFTKMLCIEHNYESEHLKALTAEEEGGPRDEETEGDFAERRFQEKLDKKIQDRKDQDWQDAYADAQNAFEAQYQTDNPPPEGASVPRDRVTGEPL